MGSLFKKRSKFFNHSFDADGFHWDSSLEYNRWIYLKSMLEKGKISKLDRQVKFTLLPPQYTTLVRYNSSGNRLKDKLCMVERACEYVADFTYQLPGGQTIVEDTKGFKTKEYVIKRKLMRYIGNPIVEVVSPCQPLAIPEQ